MESEVLGNDRGGEISERTIVGDVGDLEAPGAVGLVGLEVDPEPSGSSREGDGPLVGLTRLVGGDGRGRPWRTEEDSL